LPLALASAISDSDAELDDGFALFDWSLVDAGGELGEPV
jgi:hypothetical protein